MKKHKHDDAPRVLARITKLLAARNFQPVLKDVPVGLLNNDRLHYQRNRIESLVEKTILKVKSGTWFTPPCIVSQRPDGSLWILNGQHRAETYMRLGKPFIQCFILPLPDWIAEAGIFTELQKGE